MRCMFKAPQLRTCHELGTWQMATFRFPTHALSYDRDSSKMAVKWDCVMQTWRFLPRHQLIICVGKREGVPRWKACWFLVFPVSLYSQAKRYSWQSFLMQELSQKTCVRLSCFGTFLHINVKDCSQRNLSHTNMVTCNMITKHRVDFQSTNERPCGVLGIMILEFNRVTCFRVGIMSYLFFID